MSPVEPPRRSFLKKGLLGGLLLAVGGVGAIAVRPTKKGVSPKGPLRVFSSAEYAIFAAMAERVVGAGEGSPSPTALDVAGKADAAMARALPSVQKEYKQLLALFDNGLVGVMTGTGFAPFTASTKKAQDERLLAWSTSRMSLFRTGFQAMKRLAAACYYASPETWKDVGYPGPPTVPFPPELASTPGNPEARIPPRPFRADRWS